MPYPPITERIEAALAGEVLVNIGQFSPADVRALDKLVRAGTLAKWRGYWFPLAGAQYGVGPLKACWGLPAIRDYFLPSDAEAA